MGPYLISKYKLIKHATPREQNRVLAQRHTQKNLVEDILTMQHHTSSYNYKQIDDRKFLSGDVI